MNDALNTEPRVNGTPNEDRYYIGTAEAGIRDVTAVVAQYNSTQVPLQWGVSDDGGGVVTLPSNQAFQWAKFTEVAPPDCTANADCASEFFCDGEETCVEGVCQDGPGDPCIGEGLTCDEEADFCVCNDDTDCANEFFCDGVETCVEGVCQATGDPCIASEQLCDEGADNCVDCIDDDDCQDDNFCTGEEVCSGGSCFSDGDPCPAGETCFEDTDECLQLEGTLVLILDDPDTEGIDYQIVDGQTGEFGEVRDSAPIAGVIQFSIDEGPDGLIALATAVSKPLVPDTGEGDLGVLGSTIILDVKALRYPGSLEISLTDTDFDFPFPTTGAASITGGIIGGSRIDFFFFGDTANQPFGQGFEIFSAGFDFPEPDIDIPDALGPAGPVGSLTLSTVIQEGEGENLDANASFVMTLELVEGACVVNADCDNDLFCDGLEICEQGVCLGDPSGPCMVGETCDEENDECVVGGGCVNNADCDNDQFCDGVEMCVDGQCVDGLPPCMAGETCDEENDECVGVGGGCSVDADCDDGEFCNGPETCVETECRGLLLNGSLDDWTGGAPDGWSTGTAAGTLVEETIRPRCIRRAGPP